MSEALVWQILKSSSSKSLRRTHPSRSFTVEKGSLLHARRFYDSGLARAKAVDVSVNDDGIPVLSLKNDKQEHSRKPDRMWRTITLNGGVRKALARTDKVLSVYQPGAKKQAMRKVSAIYKAAQRKGKLGA